MLKNTKFYDFGGFRLDISERLLKRDEKIVALTPKEFELLLALVERVGEVVKKDDLLERIWSDVFVEEGTLTRNISWLRKKLETAGANGDKLIETVPRRGYRFLPVVTAITDFDETGFAEEKIPVQPLAEQKAESADFRAPISIPKNEDIRTGTPGQTQRSAALITNSPVSGSKLLPGKIIFGILMLIALAGAVALYQIYFHGSKSKITIAARIVPFSGVPGHENMPAFSPDGKQVAFAWDGGDGGNYDIYIRLLNGGEPVRLTDTPELEQYPTFSPDGTRIAFVRTLKNGGEVVLIPALGGAEQRITRLFSGFASISFSPDGNTLAVIDTPDSTAGKQFAVYLISLQTGERRRLSPPGDFIGETTPRFSPDGKQIAFIRVFNDKSHDLFVAAAGSSDEPRQLTFDRKVIHSLAWSAGSKDIFYTSYRDSNQPNIWRIAAGGGASELVMVSGADNITNLAIAPDAKTIAYVVNKKNLDIWRAVKNQLADSKFAALTYNEFSPAFSPDGTRTAFVSDRTWKNEIWTADAEGKNPRQITSSERNVAAPRFSPDNSKILYYSRSENGTDIFIVPAEGGSPFRLTDGGADNTNPIWSADGAFVYFTSNRTGEKQIWKIPSAGGEAIQITRRGASQIIAAPSDRTIFFTKADDTAVYQITGGEEQVVPSLASANIFKSWASTVRGMYFLDQTASGNFKIKFYDFQSSQIRDAAERELPADIYGSFAVSPDGNAFLYTRQNQNTSSIMLAETAG